jgi:hypothetical protein
MVTLKTYLSAVEADVDRSILEANGVKCHLADESSSVVGIGALGLRLQVESSDIERAKEILRDQNAGTSTTSDTDATPSPQEAGTRSQEI